MRIQILLLLVASDMSVGTKCEKVPYWSKKFLEMCPVQDMVFRIEKMFEINRF